MCTVFCCTYWSFDRVSPSHANTWNIGLPDGHVARSASSTRPESLKRCPGASVRAELPQEFSSTPLDFTQSRHHHSSTRGHTFENAKALGTPSATSPFVTIRWCERSNSSVRATPGGAPPTLDVAGACVQPVFRSVPRHREGEERQQVCVLFLSEGNVCRSVVAESVFQSLLEAEGLQGFIACESKAVRDYNLDEQPDPLAVEVAAQCGVHVDASSCRARLFRPAEDIVDFDLLVVMDKFNAADVLKEVSVFDTIEPGAGYSSKVRKMGSFCKTRLIQDIDDPLYGNIGGPEELAKLSDAVTDIQESCQGLLEDLKALKGSQDSKSLREAVVQWLRGMETMDWLVPPMLQKRGTS